MVAALSTAILWLAAGSRGMCRVHIHVHVHVHACEVPCGMTCTWPSGLPMRGVPWVRKATGCRTVRCITASEKGLKEPHTKEHTLQAKNQGRAKHIR